ncbi:hypothetical protein CA265_00285 [Sphingobacteriaceae bacterium GW460-11-11-14-LB5]|nr:hypothetical protein CA265_00285 [Sphingobacteriaceae bacterium GW460-11-11-14-LB5]
MATISKIKIVDDRELRAEIDHLYEKTDQVALAKWAISCAKNVLTFVPDENINLSIIETGFEINKRWQAGKASVHEVRQAGFKIHALARTSSTAVMTNAIRTAGQAVAVGHMREHAMVCADYAIKTIGLAFQNDLNRIKAERTWQLETLKHVLAEA